MPEYAALHCCTICNSANRAVTVIHRARQGMLHKSRVRLYPPTSYKWPSARCTSRRIGYVFWKTSFTMCQLHEKRGRCGHELREAIWVPTDASDCQRAVNAQWFSSSGRLHHCRRFTRTVEKDHRYVCRRVGCYVRCILLPDGWFCCECHHRNETGVRTCAGLRDLRTGQHQRGCTHEPCGECEPRSSL